MIEAKPYRQHGQVLPNAARDPLTHMERYLTAKKLFTTRWKNGLVQQLSRDLAAVLKGLRADQPVIFALHSRLQTIDRQSGFVSLKTDE